MFGNIFERKSRLARRLEIIANRLVAHPTPFLESAQSRLWSEYEHVLGQEELFWYQKSRSKWFLHGDRNTRFFHGVTAVRRRRNYIEMLQDNEGNWVGDPERLEHLVTKYFSDLFSEDTTRETTCISGAFPVLSNEEIRSLDGGVTRSEIFNVVNRMGAFKAPGPDGLQAAFLQSQWQVVGESFCDMVMEVFREHQKVEAINETLITLIPKVDHVCSITDFRPISLCNVAYKVITKILAQRLRVVMSSLVNPCQSSFIPNRQSRDNIVVAQEVFHSMRNKKGKAGWMAIKIDLEKAYDRLSWEFVKETLEDIGLPSNFIDLIWNCITTPRMRMLWNGEALEEFSPSRGIRQGDPLSPYLFVLCIEKLFQMISVAVDNGHWKPIRVARGGPMISHLAFADDVLLFAEASEEQIILLKHILDLFCRCSSQKISEAKTRIFFSKNVDSCVKNTICQASGFQMTNDLGKYLGVPILHEKINRRSFQFILDKVDSRLSNWKVKTLSFAGRLTLTYSVIQAMPSYIMQSTYLPNYFCVEIDKRCRRFLWGEAEGERHLHLVNWKNVCRPKPWSGLGLRSAVRINHASFMKAGWQMITRRDDLWV